MCKQYVIVITVIKETAVGFAVSDFFTVNVINFFMGG